MDGEGRAAYRLVVRLAALGIAWGAYVPRVASAFEVFVSFAQDGTTRYASARLDASYHLLIDDSPVTQIARSGRREGAAPGLKSLIERVAKRHSIPAGLVEAMVAAESGFDANAVSRKGARGLMQLLPSTAATYGLRDHAALHDPERNLDAGVRHLKDLLGQHAGNVPLALAAYNAGPGAVARHGGRIPPYPETMLYVAAVLARVARSTAP